MSRASRERQDAQWRVGLDEAALTLEANGGDTDAAGLAASEACVAAGLPPLSRSHRRRIVIKAWRVLWYFGWRPAGPEPTWIYATAGTTKRKRSVAGASSATHRAAGQS